MAIPAEPGIGPNERHGEFVHGFVFAIAANVFCAVPPGGRKGRPYAETSVPAVVAAISRPHAPFPRRRDSRIARPFAFPLRGRWHPPIPREADDG